MIQLLWERVWPFPKKLNVESSHDPAIPLLNINPEDLKTGTQMNPCTEMFTAALRTIATREKQPECPSEDEWANELQLFTQWDIKRNEVTIRTTTPTDLRNALLRKSQHKGHKLYDSISIKYPE